MKKRVLPMVLLASVLQANEATLEQRVQSLEEALAKSKQEALKEKMQKALQGGGDSFSQSAFLPNIALIANMSALARDVGNAAYSNYAIPGFFEKVGEIPFNDKRGFNLNYAEMEIYSTVDPYFDVDAALHIEKEGLHIGELYVVSRAMPYGLRLKMGKFKSEFGRINAKHQHAWNFSSTPLVFETFFGPSGLGDEGIQLQYTAPTSKFLQVGLEAMQGSNARSFGDGDKNNLYIGYLKSSTDLSENLSLLYGGVWMHGKNEEGDTDIYGGDLTLKYILDSYKSILWQSEVLYRDKSLLEGSQKQAGLYSEVIYDVDQNWAMGMRYDLLFKNRDDQPDDLDRYTAMLEYKPFEFSKIRLQYTYDRSKSFGGKREDMQEILLGFTIEAGAHGAHAF